MGNLLWNSAGAAANMALWCGMTSLHPGLDGFFLHHAPLSRIAFLHAHQSSFSPCEVLQYAVAKSSYTCLPMSFVREHISDVIRFPTPQYCLARSVACFLSQHDDPPGFFVILSLTPQNCSDNVSCMFFNSPALLRLLYNVLNDAPSSTLL